MYWKKCVFYLRQQQRTKKNKRRFRELDKRTKIAKNVCTSLCVCVSVSAAQVEDPPQKSVTLDPSALADGMSAEKALAKKKKKVWGLRVSSAYTQSTHVYTIKTQPS